MPVGSRAARVAGWRKDVGEWAAGSTLAGTPPASATFPAVPLDLSVAIYVDGGWLDITRSIYGGNRAQIQITRGRADEGTAVDPSRMSLELNNRDGVYSPRNPMSWLYGKIGRNTPIRVAIGGDVRFTGEICEFPSRWDTSGTDIYVPLEAAGILRRLGQGNAPVRSVLYWALTSLETAPVAYWPCEDGDSATEIVSGIGGPSMTFVGSDLPDLAANSEFSCSDPIPSLESSEWTGDVSTYTGTGVLEVCFLLSIPTAPVGTIYDVVSLYTTSTFGTLRIGYWSGDSLYIGFGGTSSFADFSILGNPSLIRVTLEQNAADVDWEFVAYRLDGTSTTWSGTKTTATLGVVTKVVVNDSGNDVAPFVVGQISVHKARRDETDVLDELGSHLGETAGARIQRLCRNEGVEYRLTHGDATDTAAMAAQPSAALLALLQEAATADGGILYEPRDFLGIAYRTRESLYRQDATLTLDYSAFDLSTIEPVDDDQALRNDITVTRPGGGSARAIKESGPLSVLPPPDGAGRYDDEISLKLEDDTTLEERAGWLLHLGTVDEPRYPILAVNLARTNFLGANASKAVAARALDVGDRLVVENPPSWSQLEDIDQLSQGFVEVLGNLTHNIKANCSPGTPWSQPAICDDGASRFASLDSTLAAGLDSTSTSVSVATPDFPYWAHTDGDFDVAVDGERMTVTAISGATTPQTFTVIRSVNGVVKAHLLGASVQLADVSVYVP